MRYSFDATPQWDKWIGIITDESGTVIWVESDDSHDTKEAAIDSAKRNKRNARTKVYAWE